MTTSINGAKHGLNHRCLMSVAMACFLVLFCADAARAQRVGKVPSADEKEQALLQMARDYFSRPAQHHQFTVSDGFLFQMVGQGKPADFSSRPDLSPKIEADCIRWLCTDQDASKLIRTNGVLIENATIGGELSLENAKFPFYLGFRHCTFERKLVLDKGEFRELDFAGSTLHGINAFAIKVDGGVFLGDRHNLPKRVDRFQSGGLVNLDEAKIGTYLVFGGTFESASTLDSARRIIQAREIVVGGGVSFAAGSHARGMVDLSGARVAGDVRCTGGIFENQDGIALRMDSVRVEGRVLLDREVRANETLSERGADPPEVLYDRAFKADGTVTLRNSVIGGDLVCDDGEFHKPEHLALDLNSLKSGHDVSLNRCRVDGFTNLADAEIAINLCCKGSKFLGQAADSLGDDLEKAAIDARGLRVGHCVFMERDKENKQGFRVQGWVRLISAKIGTFFVWRGLSDKGQAGLDLRSASIGTLEDDEDSWPDHDRLALHGFVYNLIEEGSVPTADKRMEWLNRQSKKNYLPQPYEQLAAVLRKQGKDDAASKVLIAKNEDEAFLRTLGPVERSWHSVFGLFVGYGYRPWRAFWWSMGLMVFGALLFSLGGKYGMMEPTTEGALKPTPKGALPNERTTETAGTENVGDSEAKNPKLWEVYPEFSGILFSVETFIPLLKLQLLDTWAPNPRRGTFGKILSGYLTFHVIAGWILTSLWIGGMTGIVKT